MPNPPGQCLPEGSCTSQLWLVLTWDPSQFESSRCVDLCSVDSFLLRLHVEWLRMKIHFLLCLVPYSSSVQNNWFVYTGIGLKV